MDGYSSFNMSRKQAMSVAFAIISDIEAYVDDHQAEYEQFLLEEMAKKGGNADKQDRKIA
jgi:hypothetical protein